MGKSSALSPAMLECSMVSPTVEVQQSMAYDITTLSKLSDNCYNHRYRKNTQIWSKYAKIPLFNNFL